MLKLAVQYYLRVMLMKNGSTASLSALLTQCCDQAKSPAAIKTTGLKL
jgi:hypothetical protein